MRCAPGLSLHLHAIMEQELEAFVRCIDMMDVVTSIFFLDIIDARKGLRKKDQEICGY
jgi:hypothetical protein